MYWALKFYTNKNILKVIIIRGTAEGKNEKVCK